MATMFDRYSFEEDVINDIGTYGSFQAAFLAHADDVNADIESCGDAVLCHSDSAEDPFLAHDDDFLSVYPRIEREKPGVDYGITNVEQLYPDEVELNKTPKAITEKDTRWETILLSGLHKCPYARIKMTFADMTDKDARARGYIKGNYKKNSPMLSFFRRTTSPTTIYYKQAMDRDDLIDIRSFDTVKWIKNEMDHKMDREKALAIMLGDGRLSTVTTGSGGEASVTINEDFIRRDCIRPIVYEPEIFTIRKRIRNGACVTGSGANVRSDFSGDRIKDLIDTIIQIRPEYEGTGTPTFFTTEEVLSEFLLYRDADGRYVYESVEDIKNQLNVSSIVTVPALEYTNFDSELASATNMIENNETRILCPILGILVNPSDIYECSDEGGKRTWFNKFDIDYNKEKYLVEERFGASLVKPHSCIVILNANEDNVNYPEQSVSTYLTGTHYKRNDGVSYPNMNGTDAWMDSDIARFSTGVNTEYVLGSGDSADNSLIGQTPLNDMKTAKNAGNDTYSKHKAKYDTVTESGGNDDDDDDDGGVL